MSMRMRLRLRLGAGFGLGLAALSGATTASASNVLELGDNGSEQMGRGGAWVARASDPLAAFYNPAGLAGQDTRLTLQANINIQNECFTRIKALNDGTSGDGNTASTNSTIAPGGTYPTVCNSGSPFADPQIAFTYRINPRVGVGFAVLGPSAAGQPQWPTGPVGGGAPAQRYLLLSANTLLFTPTLGVGWEPIDHLRIGASLNWGIANLDFQNMSFGANQGTVANGVVATGGLTPAENDIHGEVNVSQFFIPGFTLGTIWSPTDNLDIAGWYKFISPIDAKGYARITTSDGTVTDTTQMNCGVPGPPKAPSVCSANMAEAKINIPMEAKIGARYHQPRAGVEQAHVRDPMRTDVYDAEVDLTWANDSAFQQINISLPTIPVNGTPNVVLPANASVPHEFQDVFGVRLGGDYNVVADTLALRAGGYYQTAAQPGQYAQYQNIDFAGQWEAGLAIGGTYRIHLDKVFHGSETSALELSLGFGHTFIGTASYNTSNPQQNGVHALSGTPCNGSVSGNGVPTNGGANCTDGVQQNRTEWPVNLGTITNSFNQINVGATYRF
jgi:long-chain fatty acid transport protein